MDKGQFKKIISAEAHTGRYMQYTKRTDYDNKEKYQFVEITVANNLIDNVLAEDVKKSTDNQRDLFNERVTNNIKEKHTLEDSKKYVAVFDIKLALMCLQCASHDKNLIMQCIDDDSDEWLLYEE